MSVRTRTRQLLAAVVTGRTGGRPRAVWRVVVPFVLVVGLATAANAAAVAVLPAGATGSVGLDVLTDVLVALVALAVLAGAARYVDRRPVAGYGFGLSRSWWVDFGAGAALGVALVAVAFASSYLLGGVTVVEVVSAGDAGSFPARFLLVGVGYLGVAFWEEALLRGLFVTNGAEGLSARGLSPRTAVLGAWLVSTLAFGLVHAPFGFVPGGTSLAGMLAVWTLTGGLFGLAYVVSGELAFPIGLHFTTNYAVNNVFFGTEAAGFATMPAVIRTDVTASPLLHPYGGLPMIGAIVLGYVLALGWFLSRDGEVTLATRVATRACGRTGSGADDATGGT